MRDDFNKKVIDTLSKRVALHCSNPNCRKLTMGPNSQKQKTTNIGVAAHITAASYNGPRFDPNLTSKERSSMDNAIWLCQSCSKLIDSDSVKYTTELLKKWKTDAEKFTELELTNLRMDNESEQYFKIFRLMPDLINELIDDIKDNPLLRELILQKKGWTYNSGGKKLLVYYYEDHKNLDEKMILLENNGLINDIKYNDTQRYILTEDFVGILMSLEKIA